jgi:hypothetical protein
MSDTDRKIRKTLHITASVARQVAIAAAESGIDQSWIYEHAAKLLLEQRKRDQELLERAKKAEA